MADDNLPALIRPHFPPAGGMESTFLAAVIGSALRDCGVTLTPIFDRQELVDQREGRGNAYFDRDATAIYDATKSRFRQAWQDGFPVAELRVGDHIRHDKMGWSEREITSIKPLAKGGVQVKTVPVYLFGNRSSNPKGKTLKHELTGTCRRWDGVTEIEAPH